MTLTNTTLKMNDLYKRLKEVGFSRSFLIKSILPEWWDDSMASVPSSRLIAETILSRQLGFEFSSLRDSNAPLKLSPGVEARFKNHNDVREDQIEVAHTLANRLAHIATMCFERKPLSIKDLSAISLRNGLLKEGHSNISLPALLKFCWDSGIPVLHLCRKPVGAKQMDGAALRIGGRPAIVIACQRKQLAWQLFILAHELGHILLGHLLPDDDNIWDSKVSFKNQESDEQAADSFAVELLTGNPYMKFSPLSSWLNAHELAESARSIGSELRIDPGIIALNYAWNQGFIQVGMAALNELEPDGDAGSLFKEQYSRLDLENLPEDTRRVFESLTTAL